MTIERLTGADAERAIGDDAFVAAWASLLADCPWATSFQGTPFVGTWYAHYRELFEPRLYVARGTDGRLDGLLALAAHRTTGQLVAAGDWQAEYHAWLARPDHGDRFILAAMRAVDAERTGKPLRFRYLAPGAPLGWTEGPTLARRCVLRSYPRPLYLLGDGGDARRSLKKSGNKKRLKQLAESGPVQLRHVTEPADVAACIDEMIPLHDARHASVRGSTPFRNDPRKRGFYLALLAHPDLMHLSGLYAGDRLVAAHAGVRTGADLQFGLLAHEPGVARTSPGKFLIYHLALRLADEGVARFDLTAGGEGYKERFANDGDVVHALEIHPSAPRRAIGALACAGVARARGFIEARGLSRDGASALLHSALSVRSWATVRGRLTASADAPEHWAGRVVYRARIGDLATTPVDAAARRDDLSALLKDAEPLSRWARRRFFSAAMRRLELGQHCLSVTSGDTLTSLAWFESGAPSHGSHDRPTLPFAAGAVVWDVRVAAGVDPERALRSALAAAAEGAPADADLAVVLDPRNAALRATAERLGLTAAGPLAAPAPPNASADGQPEEKQTPPPTPRAARQQVAATPDKEQS